MVVLDIKAILKFPLMGIVEFYSSAALYLCVCPRNFLRILEVNDL